MTDLVSVQQAVVRSISRSMIRHFQAMILCMSRACVMVRSGQSLDRRMRSARGLISVLEGLLGTHEISVQVPASNDRMNKEPAGF